MKRFPAILALLLASPCWAQVSTKTVTTIYCETPVPAGAKVSYAWYAPAGLTLTANGNGASANPSGGDGSYEAVVVANVDGVKTPTAFTIKLGNAPAVPAVPKPDRLFDLTSGPTAAILADHYGTWPKALPMAATPQDFGTAEKTWRTTIGLSDAAKVYAAIDPRLNAAIAIGPWRDSVSAELGLIVKELEPSTLPPVVEPTVPITDGTPIENDGFRAVFVYESGEQPLWFQKLTTAPDVLKYLNEKCVGGPTGWRKWDQNEDVDNAPPAFQELFRVPRAGINCVVVSANKRAAVIILSKDTTVPGLLAELKKYGG